MGTLMFDPLFAGTGYKAFGLDVLVENRTSAIQAVSSSTEETFV
jgi:hypothetical protein